MFLAQQRNQPTAPSCQSPLQALLEEDSEEGAVLGRVSPQLHGAATGWQGQEELLSRPGSNPTSGREAAPPRINWQDFNAQAAVPKARGLVRPMFARSSPSSNNLQPSHPAVGSKQGPWQQLQKDDMPLSLRFGLDRQHGNKMERQPGLFQRSYEPLPANLDSPPASLRQASNRPTEEDAATGLWTPEAPAKRRVAKRLRLSDSGAGESSSGGGAAPVLAIFGAATVSDAQSKLQRGSMQAKNAELKGQQKQPGEEDGPTSVGGSSREGHERVIEKESVAFDSVFSFL